MTPEELLETIRTYNEYILKLISSLEHLCEDLAESDYQFVSPVIPAAMEGLVWIDEAASDFVLLQLLDIAVYEEFKEGLGHSKGALETDNYPLYHELLVKKILPSLNHLSIKQPEI